MSTHFLEFLKVFKKFGLEPYGRYYGTYPGIVTDNSSDPEQRGRIKIQLPTIFGKGKVHPAYAEPHSNDLAGPSTGKFFPPYIGTVVDVFFDAGDVNHPFY